MKIFWIFAAFLLRFLGLILLPFIPFVSFLKKRWHFENKNKKDPLCASFSDQRPADWLFEFSSEGEFEQIRSLLLLLLENGKRIQLVYFSPSVESKVMAFAKDYPDNIRALRFPILTFQSLYFWANAHSCALVRYDFFPELLLTMKRVPHRKVLLLASRKTGQIEHSWLKQNYYRAIYSLFNTVFFATQKDEQWFSRRFIFTQADQEVFDFRVMGIVARQQRYEEKLQTFFSDANYFEHLQEWASAGLILGNCYPSDIGLLGDPKIVEKFKDRTLSAALIPHRIDTSSKKLFLKLFLSFCEHNQLKGHWVEEGDKKSIADFMNHLRAKTISGPVVFWCRGLLCEFYPLFPLAYVGGGFGEGVHSLLEPHLAQSLVLSGPNVEHSNEKDWILSHDPSGLKILLSPHDLGTYLETFQKMAKIKQSSPPLNNQVWQRFNELARQYFM